MIAICSFLNINTILQMPLLGELGVVTFSGVTGYSAGFATKKVFKIVLIITGLLFIILQVLANYEMLLVNWPRIQTVFESAIQADYSSFKYILTAHLPETGGFIAGFALGFKKG